MKEHSCMRRLALAACPAAVARKALRPGENRRRPGSILERAGRSKPFYALSKADVVLTREKGKNGKLARLLDQRRISWLEVPLIETAAGPDREALARTLRGRKFDWITITSPEAASVFLDGWREAGSPQVCIAVVGEGSGKVLAAEKQPDLLQIGFTPSKANAKHLAAELPLEGHPPYSVLYPASAKAGDDLESGLAARDCQLLRLNTYNTLPIRDLKPGQLEAVKAAQVLAIASPSAIDAWLELTGQQDDSLAIACIGSTSAQAAHKLGFRRVFSPDSPGLDGFVTAIEDALRSCKELSA